MLRSRYQPWRNSAEEPAPHMSATTPGYRGRLRSPPTRLLPGRFAETTESVQQQTLRCQSPETRSSLRKIPAGSRPAQPVPATGRSRIHGGAARPGGHHLLPEVSWYDSSHLMVDQGDFDLQLGCCLADAVQGLVGSAVAGRWEPPRWCHAGGAIWVRRLSRPGRRPGGARAAMSSSSRVSRRVMVGSRPGSAMISSRATAR